MKNPLRNGEDFLFIKTIDIVFNPLDSHMDALTMTEVALEVGHILLVIVEEVFD